MSLSLLYTPFGGANHSGIGSTFLFQYLLSCFRYLNDLYTLDLSQPDNLQWDIPNVYGTAPTARESHSAVLHTTESGKSPRLFIYGGMSGCRLGDVYILDVGMVHVLAF